MPRLTDLEELFFPVAERPVFIQMPGEQGPRYLPVQGKKAIATRNAGRVLGIVGRDYRLVSNFEAYDLAYSCCRAVFPETNSEEWQVSGADAPFTGGYCHIDFVHNSSALDFNGVPAAQRPEVFGPFIRVTNSYNGVRALTFDIGFHRKVCKNGLILPQTIIRFKFNHMRRDIGETVEFHVDHGRLTAFKTSFTSSLGSLRDCAVPRTQFLPLVRGALSLHPPQPIKPRSRKAADWQKLQAHLTLLSDGYALELGENAYAAFNAITDIASHPPQNRCIHRDRHSLQRLAGIWLASFTTECRKPDFRLDAYLGQLTKQDNQAHDYAEPGRMG